VSNTTQMFSTEYSGPRRHGPRDTLLSTTESNAPRSIGHVTTIGHVTRRRGSNLVIATGPRRRRSFTLLLSASNRVTQSCPPAAEASRSVVLLFYILRLSTVLNLTYAVYVHQSQYSPFLWLSYNYCISA